MINACIYFLTWGEGRWRSDPLLGSCTMLHPVGTLTQDSPHEGSDPALAEECDLNEGLSCVREILDR